MKTILTTIFSLLFIPILCFAEPQDEQFDHLLAQAKKMGNSTEGQVYEKRFQRVFTKPMEEALKVCTKGTTPPYTVNVVFVIDADGTVQRIVPAPGELISIGISVKLKDLKVPPPPKAGWMVAVQMEEINDLRFHKSLSDDQPAQPTPGVAH